MKIAQVAPLHESVPPRLYGGTERIVSYLTEELVEMGHDVTLYASGDSMTKAKLKSVCKKSLRLDKKSIDPVANHVYESEVIYSDAASFDLIHSSIDYICYPILRRIKTPNITTLHGRLDIPNLKPIYREFREIPVVSISNSQRAPIQANWQGTVYHGIPKNLYALNKKPEKYLAFIGRASPEKGLHTAIEIAKLASIPIKIAVKVTTSEKHYFDERIMPSLDHPLVEFIGEISERRKQDFLGNALALLFPIGWPEPFGLVMIEAMACGTPVIAFRKGSVPEVIDDKKTGLIVRSMDEAVRAAANISRIDRTVCRKVFEKRFTARRMAKDYLDIYYHICRKRAI